MTDSQTQTLKVTWDYTDLAASYDKRADYAREAIVSMLNTMGLTEGDVVADVGAGTAKLTKELLASGLTVHAVEPNDAMRGFGIQNTEGQKVTWYKGTGEETTLDNNKVKAVFFGSSFNVVDKAAALAEAKRVGEDGAWFACMWNHRDLDDPIQQKVEAIIKNAIDGYDYGDRRADQTEILKASGHFNEVHHAEGTIYNDISVEDYIEAWRSHGTLQRQAGDNFHQIIDEISALLADQQTISVPYQTRIWFGQLV